MGLRNVRLCERHAFLSEVVQRLGEQVSGVPLPLLAAVHLHPHQAGGVHAPGRREWLHIPKSPASEQRLTLVAELVPTHGDARGGGRLPPRTPRRLVDHPERGGPPQRHLLATHRGPKPRQWSPHDGDPLGFQVASTTKHRLHRRSRIEDAGQVGSAVKAEVEAAELRRAAAHDRLRAAAAEVVLAASQQTVGDGVVPLVGHDHHQDGRADREVDRGVFRVWAKGRVCEAHNTIPVHRNLKPIAVEVGL